MVRREEVINEIREYEQRRDEYMYLHLRHDDVEPGPPRRKILRSARCIDVGILVDNVTSKHRIKYEFKYI